MFEEIKVAHAVAVADANKVLKSRYRRPSEIKRLSKPEGALEALTESIQLGIVVVHEDGTITQNLTEHIKDSKGELVLDKLKYAARVPAAAIQDAIDKAVVSGWGNEMKVYMQAYTGQAIGILNHLEPADRRIAETITLFFM
jgi:hypothetical protein